MATMRNVLAIVVCLAATACESGSANNLDAADKRDVADATDTGGGAATLQVNNRVAVWVRVDGNICPALSVIAKAGTPVQTELLPTSCCTCGVAAQSAVYRKIEAGVGMPFTWDGREFFTTSTGDSCSPLRNESRAVDPGEYVATLRWSRIPPAGKSCETAVNGDVRCWDTCEPTEQTLVPFTLPATGGVTIAVGLPRA